MYSKLIIFLSIALITLLSVSNTIVVKAAPDEDIEQINTEPEGGYTEIAEQFPLIQAAIDGDAALIQELVQDGTDVNYQNENGWTASIAAVENANYDALLKVEFYV